MLPPLLARLVVKWQIILFQFLFFELKVEMCLLIRFIGF